MLLKPSSWSNMTTFFINFSSFWAPKLVKNRCEFWIYFVDAFLIDFGSKLEPSWASFGGQNGSKNKVKNLKKFRADLEPIRQKTLSRIVWLADRAEAAEFANLQNLSEVGWYLAQLHPCGGAGFYTLPRTPPGLCYLRRLRRGTGAPSISPGLCGCICSKSFKNSLELE